MSHAPRQIRLDRMGLSSMYDNRILLLEYLFSL